MTNDNVYQIKFLRTGENTNLNGAEEKVKIVYDVGSNYYDIVVNGSLPVPEKDVHSFDLMKDLGKSLLKNNPSEKRLEIIVKFPK